MRIVSSISISPEFSELAEKYHLSWTEAARVGMAILLQQVGAMDENELTRQRIQGILDKTILQRRLTQVNALLKEAAEKIAELETKK